MWKDVHERFIQEIGVGLTTTEPGDIPSTDDIKMVRTSAWKSGYQGIVLLFDEAQLFFAGRDGPTAGDKLKLEGYLRHVAKIFPGEDDTQVITRCGVERIREPKSLELVAEGGAGEDISLS